MNPAAWACQPIRFWGRVGRAIARLGSVAGHLSLGHACRPRGAIAPSCPAHPHRRDRWQPRAGGGAHGKVAGARGAYPRPARHGQARIQAIESEGAQVTVVDGTYDEAVEASARLADDAPPGHQRYRVGGLRAHPQWVIEGYTTILQEIDTSLPHAARASQTWSPRRWAWARSRPPWCATTARPESATRSRRRRADAAACVLRSVEAGT